MDDRSPGVRDRVMIAIALSLLLYGLALATWRHLMPGGMLFYQGLALAVIAGLAHGGVLAWRGRQAAGTVFKDALLVTLLAYAFMFTIPTTVDRSYSVKLLAALGRAPDGLTSQQLESLFAVEFVGGGAVARRIDEQTRSGFIENGGAGWRLTQAGRAVTRSFELACAVFVCQNDQRKP